MNKHNIKPGKISHCQICFSKNLTHVISLGNQPLANTLIDSYEKINQYQSYPINVVRCNECTLLQIDYIVDQEKVYHPDYPYLPGITPTVSNEQKELAKYLNEKLQLNKEDLVVDIGSNDGSLLKSFKLMNLNIIGVEPTNIAKLANSNGVKTLQSFFNLESAKKIAKEFKKAKLITSTNVFAHMSTLGDVMDGIVELLDDNGYFCFENHYIMNILENVQYDTFYHEHLRTYSLISLEKLFEQYNLYLNDAQKVPRYGGSIRCLVSKNKKKTKRLIELIDIEKKNIVENSEQTYEIFKNKIKDYKKKLIQTINNLKKEGKYIVAKSCPARAVVLLNYCELNQKDLDYIAEQPTSLKLDKFVPGTDIKIVEDSILFKQQPDYVLLLAWHLKDAIVEKWKKKGLKSKFIIPLPNVEII